MAYIERLILVVALFTTAIFLSSCGSSNMHPGSGSGAAPGSPGSGTSGSGSSSGSGVGSNTTTAAPGFGAGIGASGQKSAARFLYANPVPGGGPDPAIINSNGTLLLQAGGSANNANPMTMAIDPTG